MGAAGASEPRDGERVGLDVGGSSVKAGRVRADGEVLEERSVDVPEGVTGAKLAGILVELARGLGVEHALGVGLPGLLDRDAGAVTQSPNLPYLEGFPLRDTLARDLGLPPEKVVLENDANLAAVGERWLGAARERDDFLLVTLGTGVGGGLVLTGKLYVGAGLACEVGHVNVHPDGPACGCGKRGCIEVYSSATAAERRARAKGLPRERPGDLRLLAERARAGEKPDAELLADVGRDLGRGLAAVVNLLDVRHFYFGGGFSAALDCMRDGVREGLRERAFGSRVEEIRLERASLGNRAGWIGAARSAFDA